jgi:hypothetical protein
MAQAEPVVGSGGAPVGPGEDDQEHPKRIEALAGEKSTMSRNGHTRETQGWIVIQRPSGGEAESVEGVQLSV